MPKLVQVTTKSACCREFQTIITSNPRWPLWGLYTCQAAVNRYTPAMLRLLAEAHDEPDHRAWTSCSDSQGGGNLVGIHIVSSAPAKCGDTGGLDACMHAKRNTESESPFLRTVHDLVHWLLISGFVHPPVAAFIVYMRFIRHATIRAQKPRSANSIGRGRNAYSREAGRIRNTMAG